jgi:thiol-disulfide isomerase/thioredoxin
MKTIRKAMLLIVVSVMAASCNDKPATSYTIECNLQGIPDSTKIELTPIATNQREKPVAEGVITNGKAVLTGVADEPRLYYLSVANGNGGIRIVVENGKIVLTGKVKTRELEGGVSYDLDSIEIKGSKSHDLYLQKTALMDKLKAMYAAFYESNKEMSDAFRQAMIDKDTAKIDSLEKTDAYKKLIEEQDNFYKRGEEMVGEIILENKDSWWGPLLMLDLMSYLTPRQKAWYEALSQEAKDSFYDKIVEAELYPKGFTGKPAPAFTFTDKDDKETDLAAITVGKKYTLIDFWASWCVPCRKEIPNLKKLYEKYASKGFEIVSISTDRKKADWEKALEEEKLPWPSYLDTKGASEVFKIKTIPAVFLLDDNGIIIAESIRGEELEAKLAELFQ